MCLRAGADRHIVKEWGGGSDLKVMEAYYMGTLSATYRAAMNKVEGADNATAAG